MRTSVPNEWERVLAGLRQIRTPETLESLDQVIDSVVQEGWGEIHLIVENGRLRWVRRVTSQPFNN
jgi:hypothetical protein